jgi:hypothetical protein
MISDIVILHVAMPVAEAVYCIKSRKAPHLAGRPFNYTLKSLVQLFASAAGRVAINDDREDPGNAVVPFSPGVYAPSVHTLARVEIEKNEIYDRRVIDSHDNDNVGTIHSTTSLIVFAVSVDDREVAQAGAEG